MRDLFSEVATYTKTIMCGLLPRKGLFVLGLVTLLKGGNVGRKSTYFVVVLITIWLCNVLLMNILKFLFDLEINI